MEGYTLAIRIVSDKSDQDYEYCNGYKSLDDLLEDIDEIADDIRFLFKEVKHVY